MLAEAVRLRWRGRAIAWLLAAWIAGTALQILQPALWPAAAYWALGGVGVAAAAVGAALGARHGKASLPLLAVASGAIAFAAVGLNAGVRAGQALAPVLEGASLRVVGVIAAMPQRSDAGQRFRFGVERATLDGRPVTLPPQLQMAWYASAATAACAGAASRRRCSASRASIRMRSISRAKPSRTPSRSCTTRG